MPVVIREQNQFRVQQIGVARGDRGDDLVPGAIVRGANQLASMFFEKAAEEAQQAGTEAALSASQQSILTINPQTGEPEAYAAPEGFGGIATTAYQNLITRRFRASIEDEMQNRARVLAEELGSRPNGVDLYTESFGNYVEQMASHAQGQFRGMITDMGTTYLNSTRSNLQVQAIRRQRAAAAAFARQQTANAIANAERTGLQLGFQAGGIGADGSPSPVSAIQQSAEGVNADARAAGVEASPPTEASRSVQRAYMLGAVRHALINSGMTSDELAMATAAMTSYDFSAIPNQELGVRLSEYFANDPRGYDAIVSDITQASRNQGVIAQYEETQQARSDLASFADNFDQNAFQPGRTGFTTDEAYLSAADSARTMQSAQSAASRALESGVPQGAVNNMLSVVSARYDNINSSIRRDLATEMASMSDEQASALAPRIQLALQSGDTAGLPTVIARQVQGIIDLQIGNPSRNYVDSAVSYAGQLGSAINRREAADNAAAFRSAYTYVRESEAGYDQARTIADVDALISQTTAALGDQNLSFADAQRIDERTSQLQGRAFLRIGLNAANNTTHTQNIVEYINNPTDQNAARIPAGSREAIDRARESGLPQEQLLELAGAAQRRRNNAIEVEIAEEQSRILTQNILNGTVDPSSEDAQTRAQQIVGDLPVAAILNPESYIASFPEGSQEQQAAIQSFDRLRNISPSILPTSAIQAIEAVASGSWNGPIDYAQMVNLLSNVASVRLDQYGNPVQNNGVQALSDGARAFVDHVLAYAQTNGINELAGYIAQTRQIRSAPGFDESFNSFWQDVNATSTPRGQRVPAIANWDEYRARNFPETVGNPRIRSVVDAYAPLVFASFAQSQPGVIPDNDQVTAAFRAQVLDRMITEDPRILAIDGSPRTTAGLTRIFGSELAGDVWHAWAMRDITAAYNQPRIEGVPGIAPGIPDQIDFVAEEAAGNVRLMPFGPYRVGSGAGQQYLVQRRQTPDGPFIPQMYPMPIPDESGAIVAYAMTPMVVGTHEPNARIAVQNALERSSQFEAAAGIIGGVQASSGITPASSLRPTVNQLLDMAEPSSVLSQATSAARGPVIEQIGEQDEIAIQEILGRLNDLVPGTTSIVQDAISSIANGNMRAAVSQIGNVRNTISLSDDYTDAQRTAIDSQLLRLLGIITLPATGSYQ